MDRDHHAAAAGMNVGVRNGRGCIPEAEFLPRLRSLAVESLGRMFDRRRGLFHFCVRKTPAGIVPEGVSRRYTAISLIGLAGEEPAAVRDALSGDDAAAVYDRLLGDTPRDASLGDVALTLWAGIALGHRDAGRAAERLRAMRPDEGAHPTVELSWALAALCHAGYAEDAGLRDAVAKKLQASFRREPGIFPHVAGNAGRGARSHVSCFADLVYPVQSLSLYARLAGDRQALDAAERCAAGFCARQGSAGQWWWHYDGRTGNVVEGYPVYAIHQDAMAPMALFALEDAGGSRRRKEVALGLEWLRSSPELSGGTLVDAQAGIVWRKVARSEPGKLSRYLQAGASAVHPALRVPGLDAVFPPRSVDFEDRPYHIGWLLHAWPADRVAAWGHGEAGA